MYFACKVPDQCNDKGLMKLSAVPEKTLKILKCLPNILVKMDIMNLSLLPSKIITIRDSSWKL